MKARIILPGTRSNFSKSRSVSNQPDENCLQGLLSTNPTVSAAVKEAPPLGATFDCAAILYFYRQIRNSSPTASDTFLSSFISECTQLYQEKPILHIDSLFEFSTYLTREEWEAEERKWQEYTEEFERRSAKQKASSELSRSDTSDDDIPY